MLSCDSDNMYFFNTMHSIFYIATVYEEAWVAGKSTEEGSPSKF